MAEQAHAESGRQAVPHGIIRRLQGDRGGVGVLCEVQKRGRHDRRCQGQRRAIASVGGDGRGRGQVPPCRPRHRRTTRVCTRAAPRRGSRPSCRRPHRRRGPPPRRRPPARPTARTVARHLARPASTCARAADGGSAGTRRTASRYAARAISMIEIREVRRRIRPGVHTGDRPWSRRSFRPPARSPCGCGRSNVRATGPRQRPQREPGARPDRSGPRAAASGT